MVRLFVDDEYVDDSVYNGDPTAVEKGIHDFIEMKVVERGTTLTVPATVEGFKNILWSVDGEPSTYTPEPFVVKQDMDIKGIGEITSTTDPVAPVPEPNPVPDTPAGKPLEQPKIDQIVQEIQNSSNGEQVKIAMGDATVISNQILKSLKGKDITVKLNMGGYTWTINGMDIVAANLKDINLEVKMDTDVIASDVINKIAGDNPVRQLSLTHNGNFGFKAKLTMNLGAEYSGKYGNLFYYDSAGKLVYMNAGTIDTTGNVTLEFSHASDYAIVIADRMMSSSDGSGKAGLSPKTGDGATGLPYGMIMGTMILLAVGIKTNKKYW